MKFQELCLQYGENNLTREQLIQYIKLTEALHELDLTFSDAKVELSEEHRKFTDKCLTAEYQNLKIKYDLLYSKWEQFSKCLNMGPEKFISMLEELKEKLKSKGNEIVHLREQLKTSELDAKRYKNDGIQDRVKLQEVTEELEKVKKLMDTPCKEVKELIDNLKQMNADKMDTISKLEAALLAANKDKEMMLSYTKHLESIIKKRDNWKADCENVQKCFQEERSRRWELEEEVKQLKNQVQSLLDALDEVCPKQKVDPSSYVKSKKELDELVEKRLSIFEEPTLKVIGNDIDGYHNIYVNFVDELLFVDNVKNNLSSLKDSLSLVEFSATYAIKNIENGNYLYVIYKSSKNVEKLTHIELEHLEYNTCNCCECVKKKDKKIHTSIYFTRGAERILVDTVPFWVDYWHYNIGEDSTKTRYVIVRKDPMQKDLHNYSIDKKTLKVKVID